MPNTPVAIYRVLTPNRLVCSLTPSAAVCIIRLQEPLADDAFRALSDSTSVVSPTLAAVAGLADWDPHGQEFPAQRLIMPYAQHEQ